MGSDPKVVEKEEKDLSAPEFDFGSLYESYPRRVGRAKGLEVCAKKVTTRADYEQLEAAVSAMARAWDGAPRDQLRYCPHFATWVNQERWRDTEQEGPAGAVAVVRADPDYDPDNPDPPEVQRAMREMYRDAPPPEL